MKRTPKKSQKKSGSGSKGPRPLVLVTGGAGYLGSTLVPMLLDKGYQVHVLDRLFFTDDGLAAVRNHPHLKITNQDILHHENIPGLFKDVDAVVHLASISNDPSCDLDPNLTIETNFLATMSLARRAKAEKVKRFVFMSSCSVYGANGDKYLDEKSITAPVTLYALSKLQAERELVKMGDKNFNVVALRLATLFGLSKRMRFDLAVNAMTKRALQGQNIIVNGDGSQYRPFLHVRDASRAIMYALELKRDERRKVFNVGNEKLNYSIDRLAKEVHTHFPNIQIERVIHNNDVRSYRVRFDRFGEQCGFETQYTVADAISEMKKAVASGELSDMDNAKFYNVMVMKGHEKITMKNYSLASSPIWASKEPLLRSS